MKLRRDFVTNSSSSSFIMGKKGDNLTTEIVYGIVRNYYIEFRDAVERLKQDANKYNVFYEYVEDAIMFDIRDGDYIKISKYIKEKYGIDLCVYYTVDFKWLNCETYKEYVSFWKEEVKVEKTFENTYCDTDILKRGYVKYAPFYIVDYSKDKCYNVLYTDSKDIELPDKSEISSLLGFYLDFPYWIIEGEGCEDWNCFDCHFVSENDKEFCKWKKENVNSSDIMSLFVEKLGKICIHSEDGYMPYYVTDKLKEISNYGCVHMG